MHNDSVLSASLFARFVGTPAEVRKWLKANDPEFLSFYHDVFVGSTGEMMSIPDYLERAKNPV